jgi:hypothetical protein
MPVVPGFIPDTVANCVAPFLPGYGIALHGVTSGYAGFKPAPIAGSTVWQLPAVDGTGNQALVTNGAGVLSFGPLGTQQIFGWAW